MRLIHLSLLIAILALQEFRHVGASIILVFMNQTHHLATKNEVVYPATIDNSFEGRFQLIYRVDKLERWHVPYRPRSLSMFALRLVPLIAR